jgi:hypothetical protein
MSLLTIAKEISINVGIAVPASVMSANTDDSRKIIQFTQEAANEIAQRVDWNALRASTTITGTGSNDDFSLPARFSRLSSGMAVSVNGSPVRGGISPDEWFALTPRQGTPRYYRVNQNFISFYPYPASGANPIVSYLTDAWCSSGGKVWVNDSDAALIPETLISKNAIWRWLRQMGQDYRDQLAEFEAALSDLAKFDGGVRAP